MRILKSSFITASSCGSCGSMIHGSSDLNFPLQVAQLALTRMSCLRETRSLQLSEKRLFCFECWPNGSVGYAVKKPVCRLIFRLKNATTGICYRSVCLCISLRWKGRSVCAFLTGLLHHVRYSASIIAPRVFQHFKTAEKHQSHDHSLAVDVAMPSAKI